jgi:hypothetical protein
MEPGENGADTSHADPNHFLFSGKKLRKLGHKHH